MPASGTLHLLVGPVGAGKTTYARRRIASEPALLLDLDAWMVRLFGDDERPADGVLSWYLARRERCRALMWDTADEALRASVDVYLELGLLTVADRAQWLDRAAAADLSPVVHLLDAPREVRRGRVAQRNERAGPHTQVVPLDFFERASDAWEPLTSTERAAWTVVDG